MIHARIEMNPEIMGGKPVIRGTRVPVELVLRKLGAGMTEEEILADHSRLTADGIRAAQAFTADYLANEETGLSLSLYPCSGLPTNASMARWSGSCATTAMT
jgi:uncharacterized protein (DUF433 family)